MARKKADRAESVIRFIETHLKVPKGDFVNRPVELRDWQKGIIRQIYGPPATRQFLLSLGRKNGKALALDTPIPTPHGWRRLRDIEPDDEVFGADGRHYRVLATSPVFIGKSCYRLSFSDGTAMVASGDHLWLTEHRFRPWAKPSRRQRSGNGGRRVAGVVSTEQIASSVTINRPDGVVEFNHRIQRPRAMRIRPVDLPLDPYLLGAWLGDGKSSAGSLTAGDEDVAHFASETRRVVGGDPVMRRDSTAWTIGLTTGRFGAKSLKVQAVLRRLGVLGAKHIPQQYLWSGTDQRRALLQGLMDTDGTICRTGRSGAMSCSFTSVSERLAKHVLELVRSLGIKAAMSHSPAKLYGRVVGTRFLVQFTAWQEDEVFRLPRKAQRLLPRPPTRVRSDGLKIIGCEPAASVPTKCLMVDSPDHLFLAGEGLTPTHNSALIAMLVLAHLVGPEAKRNAEIYSAAQSREQAAIVFNMAAQMVRMGALSDPGLVIVRDSAKELFSPLTGVRYKALSADATTAYGFAPSLAIHDELGQVRGPRSELYSALETAMGSVADPLSLVISTQAPTDADLLSTLIDSALSGEDPKRKVALFSAPLEADPWVPETWKLANPALGDFLSLEELEHLARTAKLLPAEESSFRNLNLNQRVATQDHFLSPAVWALNAVASDLAVLEDRAVYVGADLSATRDLTALFAGAMDSDGTWHFRQWFFLPEEGLRERAQRDRVPYDLWREQGYLTTTPGKSVNYDTIAAIVVPVLRRLDVRGVAYDRWQFEQLKQAFSRHGWEPPFLQDFGQGYKTMSPALRTLEQAALEGRLRHGNNPILRMCAENARVKPDDAGNRKLVKRAEFGRIDGMIALTMMVAAGSAALPDPQSDYYAKHDLLVV